MTKLRSRIQSILNEYIEDSNQIDETNFEYTYIINISTSSNVFYKQNKSMSEFYKKLSNSKVGLRGNKNNREWWNYYEPNGFYFFSESNEVVEVKMMLQTHKKLNELEFKSRVKRLLYPCQIEISLNDKLKFETTFSEIFRVNSGMQVFGKSMNN